ncbi:RyR domain-containing protein [Dactylosporangium sp. NPDC000244]|uniref:RyR domain-containing protein n=1 Tax=Dactylosporangium sp. NPDC000244 TaxID=3154365 RepID=UPI003327126B
MIDPDILESVAGRVHDRWLATKAAQGCTSRLSETGEELMVPYADLPEPAKDLDRGTVRTVLAALEEMTAGGCG